MPPRKKTPPGPTPVDAITHEDKRANIPTADAQDLVTPEVEKPITVTYPRDLYSPMLIWQGKEALDEIDLEADAPPIYIQEKIDPRVLIENLRKTASASRSSGCSSPSTDCRDSISSSSTRTRRTGPTA